jgi:putative RecB family exonuclease
MYQECPQKYKFKYIEKIPEKPRHFFSFGQSVHLALEFFYGVKTPPAPTLEEVLEHYEKIWVSLGYKDKVQEAEYFADGKDILTRYYKKHIGEFFIPYFVEYNFSLEVDGVPVTGKVDRVDRLDDGRIAILDYKTGKSIPASRVDADFQLTMYQLACERLLDAKVAKLSFYHLPTLKELSIERHPEGQVDNLRKRITTTAESIIKEEFAPKPEEMKCRWCDYKPICPVFRAQFPGAAAPERPASAAEPELAALIDDYGVLQEKAGALQAEMKELRERIVAKLKEKGFVRAFGQKFEATVSHDARWEFSDKAKVLDTIKKAGLYDRILAPSAPLVQQLMADSKIEPEVKAKLESLGEKTDSPDLKLKALEGRKQASWS